MDRAAIKPVLNSVDETARGLLVREPYFGHLLVGTVRAVADGDFAVRLAPIGHLAQLEVGAAGWARLSAPARVAALKHELLHLTLHHPLRSRAYPVVDLWGLACDLVVNQLFDIAELDGAIILNHFPDLDLKPDQTADAYYHQLLSRYGGCFRGTCAGAGAGACDSKVHWWQQGGGLAHSSWAGFAAAAGLGAACGGCNGSGTHGAPRPGVARRGSRSGPAVRVVAAVKGCRCQRTVSLPGENMVMGAR